MMKTPSSCRQQSSCRHVSGSMFSMGVRRRWWALAIATSAVVLLGCFVEAFQQQRVNFGIRRPRGDRTIGYISPTLGAAKKDAASESGTTKKGTRKQTGVTNAKKDKSKKKGKNKGKEKKDKTKKERKTKSSKRATSPPRTEKRPISKRRVKKKTETSKTDNPKKESEVEQLQEPVQQKYMEEELMQMDASSVQDIEEKDEHNIQEQASTQQQELDESLGQVKVEQASVDTSNVVSHQEEEEGGKEYTEREELLLQEELLVEETGQIDVEQASMDGSDSVYNDSGGEDTYVSPTDFPITSYFKLTTPEEAEFHLEENQRLVCIGDVHGDYYKFVESLTIAGVYDETNEDSQWVGGNTILVQCGDILDRGSQELSCFALLARLSRQAAEQGGHVIVLYGNHEVLNAAGLFHYTEGDEEYEEILGHALDRALDPNDWRQRYAFHQPARWAAYEPGGLLSQSLMKNLKVAVKVGRTVCVHAGLTAEHIHEFGGLSEMNREAQQWISQVVGMREAESHVVEETTEGNDEHATNGEINGDAVISDVNGDAAVTVSPNGEINGATGNGEKEVPIHATNGDATGYAEIIDEVNGEDVVTGNENDETNVDATTSGDNVNGEDAAVIDTINGESITEPTNGEMEVEPVQEQEEEAYATEYKTREEAVAARQAYTYATIPRVLGGGMGEQSPLWMRDYSSPGNLPPRDPVRAQNMIDECLQLLDCDRMVMGHTVQREINCALNGKAWRVDIGASRGVLNGSPEVLEVCRVNDTEVVSVLSKKYGKIPESERQIFEFDAATFFFS